MKILLTGATGLLGSHLLEAMLERGYSVITVKRSFSNTWRIDHLLTKVKAYDIDRIPLEAIFEENKIDVVIHTATHYGRTQEPASEIVDANLDFPLRLLETAIRFDTDTFFNTDTLLDRHLSNYALSKKQFAEWLKVFSEARKIRGINLKIEHMYGPGGDEKNFITWVLKQMIHGAKKVPLTRGEQKRDFVYISDVVDAYLLLLEKQEGPSSYSEFEVGTGQSVSIKSLVLRLKELVGRVQKREIETLLDFGSVPYRKGEPMEIQANISKLAAVGWKPKVPLDVGLRVLVEEELR